MRRCFVLARSSALIFTLFFLVLPTSYGMQGPCARKFLGTGDRLQDTEQLTMYLELLLNERVISVAELAPFISELENNKVINPIPNQSKNKQHVFHRNEIEKLLATANMDIELAKKSIFALIKRNETKQNQKDKTEIETFELPVYTAYDGALFYEIKHPVLGDAYKILKPNGIYENPSDWEEKIWAKNTLSGFGDSLATKLMCEKLGAGTELPSKDDYIQLFSHFQQVQNKTIPFDVELSDPGKIDFKKVFGDRHNHELWSSTVHPSGESGWMFIIFRSISNYYPLHRAGSARCVAPFSGVKP